MPASGPPAVEISPHFARGWHQYAAIDYAPTPPSDRDITSSGGAKKRRHQTLLALPSRIQGRLSVKNLALSGNWHYFYARHGGRLPSSRG